MGTVEFDRSQKGDSDPPMVYIGVHIFLLCQENSFHFGMDHDSGDPVFSSSDAKVGRFPDLHNGLLYTIVTCKRSLNCGRVISWGFLLSSDVAGLGSNGPLNLY